MEWQTVVLGILAMLNVTATVAVVRSDVFSPAQKGWQFGLIWLVPLIGAIACLLLVRNEASQADGSLPPHDLAPGGFDGASPDFVPTLCGCNGGGAGSGGEGGD